MLTILLDMDEVLTDFIGGAVRIHGAKWGFTRAEINAQRRPGEWDIVRPIGRWLRQQGHHEPFTPDHFWSAITEAGSRFWIELERLPWAYEMVDLVARYTSDWHIVTAPSKCATSYSGKVQWLKTEFGPDFDQFVITPHKHILANSRAILIDDREKNISSFIEAGGRGILFPNVGNCLRDLTDDPVKYVTSELVKQLHQAGEL